MLEYVSIRYYLFAATFPVTALEFDLCEEVACDSIDLIELAVTSTEWTVVRVLGEPVTLAVGANWLLTDLTLKWILQDVIADAADKFGKECGHVRFVLYEVLLVYIPTAWLSIGVLASCACTVHNLLLL